MPRQRRRGSPSKPAQRWYQGRRYSGSCSATFGRPLAEQSFRPEDEDQDQDREDDRLRPLRARRVPGKPLVELLDEADEDRPQDSARKIADPAEDRGRKCDQSELEALVVADVRRVERVQEAGDPRERARDQKRERDRAVDVDP